MNEKKTKSKKQKTKIKTNKHSENSYCGTSGHSYTVENLGGGNVFVRYKNRCVDLLDPLGGTRWRMVRRAAPVHKWGPWNDNLQASKKKITQTNKKKQNQISIYFVGV